MRVLGLDPALASIGVAVLWAGDKPGDVELLEYTVLETPAGRREGERLLMIRRWFESFLTSRMPQAVAIERPAYYGKKAYNILPVGMAYGEILCCLEASGLRAEEYAPQTVKKAATGKGDAGKLQVKAAIKARFGEGLTGKDDGFDAIAVALTHALRLQEEWRGPNAG